MDVATGSVLADRIPNCRAASVAWQPDGTGFWYTVYPEGDEYHRHIRHHTLGADPATHPDGDPVVFDRLPSAESWPDVSNGRDGRHLLVHVMVGWTQIDVHLLDTVQRRVWRTVVEGVDAQTALRIDGDALVGVTTLGAPNGRVVRASLTDSGPTGRRWCPSDPTWCWARAVPLRRRGAGGGQQRGRRCGRDGGQAASGSTSARRQRGGARRRRWPPACVRGPRTFCAPVEVLRYTAADGVQRWSRRTRPGPAADAHGRPRCSTRRSTAP